MEKRTEFGWYLTYDGSSHNTPVTWDEINQEYQAEPRTIVMTDGEPGDVMYSSGLPSAKYVWEPENGNIPLMDSDYRFYKFAIQLTERDAKQMQGKWIGDLSTHSEVSDYEGIDIYLRYQNTENFVFYKTVYAPSVGGAITVNLPDNVVGYQLRHRTSFYATTLQVLGYSYLLPSARVQALIQEDVDQDTTSIIKNKSDCVIYDEAGNAFFNATNYAGGNNPANKEIYELNTSTTYQYTRKYAGDEDSTIFDVKQGTQDNPMYIAGYNYNNSGRRKQVKTGVFYDLLPEGTTVDTDTIFGIPLTGNSSSVSDLADRYDSYKGSSSRIPEALYDVRFITDWQGSGRTMMVIRFTAPEGVNATGMQFWYMLHNTYENVRENGTTVENDVAFVNTTEGAVRPYSLNGTQSTISQAYREYYDSLQTENEGFISYAKDSTNYIPVDAFSWGFVKTVKTDVDYEQSSVIIPNNEYTYRLTYTQSDYAESSDIVFFDILEGGVYREEQSLASGWHGVLKSIDVSGADSKLTDGSSTVHCQPVVYYSTKDRGAFTGADYDVTNTATWTTERPEDASTITAIAVDCTKNEDGSDFVMKGLQVIDIYITMTAPTDEEFYGKTTYNEGVIYARKDDALEPTPEYSDTAVTLENADPVIHKESDPETGAEESPARAYIDSELTYTLSVTNEDERFTLHDILVEDTLPDGLNIDTSNIMVHFGDPDGAVKLSVSPRVSLKKSGQALAFTISSLQPGETVYLEIPSLVTGKDGDILENTAEITSVNGVEKSLHSETTWHEVKEEIITKVSITKTGLGDGEPVVGATLVLKNTNGEEVARWVTDGKPHVIEGLEPGEYTLIEEEAPVGYLKAEDKAFTIQEVKEIQEVDMKDDYTKIQVSKKDTDGKMVSGASLAILDGEGNQVAAWETDGTPYTIYKLPAGEYTLIETSAPEGYLKAEDKTFAVTGTGEIQAVEMVDDYTKVQITKVDPDGNMVVGAALELLDSNGKQIDVWTTTEEAHTINKLPTGTYTLKETSVPDGYLKAADKEFTIKETSEVQVIEMVDDYTKVQITKSDPDGGPVIGASMEILDAKGEQVASWTTTETPYVITKLPAGEYTLKETAAPAGYIKAADITFAVTETAELQEVNMVDAVTQVQVTKVSSEDDSPVVGAVLVIKDAEGKEFTRWTTTDQPHLIKMIPAGSYTLVEESAPKGFLIADPVPFEVKDSADLVEVEMVDEASKGQISLKKVDYDDPDTALEGVEFGIFTSKDCREEDLVETIVTDKEGSAVSDILPFGTYYVKETKAKDNYMLSDTVYTVELEENGVTVPVTTEPIKNKSVFGSIRLEKYKLDGKTPLQGVTFSLEGPDGKTQALTTGADGIVTFEDLKSGKYTITETKTAAGMTLLAEPITVTLPLTMTEAEAKESGADLTKGYLHSDGKYYFYDLTYRVTNSATLDMPASGGHGFPIAVYGAALAAAGILLATKRKRRRSA